MKKIIFLFIVVILGAIIYFNASKLLNDDNSIFQEEQRDDFQKEESFIFVPYWTFSSSLGIDEFDSLIYFGLTFDENGLNRQDEGFDKMKTFSGIVPSSKKKYLTLRIIGEESSNFLDDKVLQKKVGSELREVSKEFGFDGVVVDFETSAFGFSSIEERITSMYSSLQEEIKKEDLEFIVLVFGDSYYRARPYNIKKINSLSDKVIVMTYDFHKARLNPGPNFPLSGKEKYGYDIKTMVDDFRKDMDFEKIAIALGYFGYDWKLSDGFSVETASSLSLHQVNSRFINNCQLDSCRVSTNNDGESVVRYIDEEGFNHEVWYEDENSINKKIEYLNSIGIKQIGFWAYSFY